MTAPNIPPAPSVPTPKSLSYIDTAAFSTYAQGWTNRDAAQQAYIAELEAQHDVTTGTRFGIDLSDLTTDKPLTEPQKVDSHRAAGLKLTDVRVFFGSSVPSWNAERIKALDPSKGDSIVISTLSRDVAGMTTFLKNTPDAWRGHVDLCHGHERDADLLASVNPTAAVSDWLAGCQEKATMLDGLGAWGYSSDNFGKITLHYTQEADVKASNRNTRERFHGGQDFGWWGEDCYHRATWLNNTTGRTGYETVEELFGNFLDFTDQIGRPARVPEWGSVLAKVDPTGVGRAKAITDGGAYLKSRGVEAANWWCGSGSPDVTQPGGVRNFHLEGTPALAAYLAL